MQILNLLIGTCVQTDVGRREVTESEGRLWAETKRFLYFETSAQTGQNVVEMFEVRKILYVLSSLPHCHECVELGKLLGHPLTEVYAHCLYYQPQMSNMSNQLYTILVSTSRHYNLVPSVNSMKGFYTA